MARSDTIDPSYGAGQDPVDELVPDVATAAENVSSSNIHPSRAASRRRSRSSPAPGLPAGPDQLDTRHLGKLARPLSQDRNSPDTGENCSTPERWKSSTSCRE